MKYFDPNLIPEEAFGGRYQFSNEKSTGFETEPYQGENIKNAYMLFYRRKNSSSFTNCLKDISSLPERTRQIVRDDNASLILHMQIFNPDFFHFLFRILKTFDGSVDETFLVQCTSAIFDVVARSANNEILPEMLNWLVSICKESPIIAKSALLILCRDPNMIFELVLGHHETFIRTCCCNFFSELLVIVLSTEHKLLGLQKEVVYESSSSKINEAEHLKFFVHRAAAESFVDILLGFQSLLYQNLDKSSNYFGIFLHVALADDLARFLLLKRNFISRFGSLLLGDQNSLTARGNSYSSSAVSSAFDNFIKTAVLLVRACKTDHGIPRSTVIIPSVGIQELSGMDKRIILHREFYSRSLANGYNADAIAGIMCHWAWNWTEYSRSVASIVLDGARKATEENIESYLDVCFSFLEIDDSLVDFRIQLLFDSKGNLLELTEISRHSQPMFTFLCIQKIAKATLTNIHLAEFLRQCQHRWDWFRSWLHNYPNRYLGSHKFDPSELLRVQNAALELCEQLDRLVEQFGRRIPEEVVTENNPSTSAIGTMYDSAPILSLDPSSGREILNLKAGGYSFHDPPLGEFSTDSIEGELDKLVLDDENVVPGEQASDESDQSLYLEENAPSPGESTHSSWHCSNCTYQNSLEKTTCDICSRFRL